MPSRRYSAADLQAMIPLYLDGVLDAEERAAVEAYWSEHPDAALAHFAVSGSLIDLLDEVVTPRPVDDAFVDDVMAAIHDLTPARRRRERWAMTAPLTMVRWLAETSLVLLLGWLLLTHPWAPAVSAVECRLLGDATWVLGRPAAVRVLVTARGSQTPVVNAEVRLRLQHPHQLWRTTVFRGRTNEQGTLDTDVRLEPAVPAGDCWLLAEVDSPRGRATAWHALTLAQRWKLTVEPVADRVPAGGRVVARVALSDAGSGKPGRGPVTWRLDDAGA